MNGYEYYSIFYHAVPWLATVGPGRKGSKPARLDAMAREADDDANQIPSLRAGGPTQGAWEWLGRILA